MNGIKITKVEFNNLRDYIRENCGISLGDEKDYLVENRLSELARQNGCENFKDFLFKAKAEPHLGLRDKIVDAMTTNETLWFRDNHPFEILKEVLFPQFQNEFDAGVRHNIRIWSAACSTGQEPYSIAMSVLEYCRTSLKLKPAMFSILATDISPSALYLAMNGKYDGIAMSRGMSDVIKERYFENQGRVFSLKPEVKNMVKFKKFNLQNSFMGISNIDIIFCRYVAIYFSSTMKRDLFKKFSQVLNPGGSFFLGGTEFMTGYSDAFSMQSHKTGRFYKLEKSV